MVNPTETVKENEIFNYNFYKSITLDGATSHFIIASVTDQDEPSQVY
jgi:hypothetical protein